MLDALRTHPVVSALAAAFASVGEAVFLVGGSVRDACDANLDFSDLDFTTRLRPEQFRTLIEPLGPVWDVGAAFGTLGVSMPDGSGTSVKVEITTFRSESYDPDSRKPEVAFGDSLTEDLLRRDLTINAMAMECTTGELIDPFGGRDDLAAGVLRTPNEPSQTVSEDPLRQIRVVRFAVKRGMRIDPALAAAVVANAHRLAIVAPERRTEELRKILAAGPRATAQAIGLATELGIVAHLFAGLETGPAARTVLEGLPSTADAAMVLAALVTLTGATARTSMVAMKLSNDEILPALAAERLVGTIAAAPPIRVEARRLVRDNSDAELTTASAVLAAMGSFPAVLDVVAEVLTTEPKVRLPLPVDGNDLVDAGLKGKAVGDGLRRVTEAFLADPGLDRRGALAAALG